ncbi:hypothetical protein COU75_04395, partial [Candidatus Peregrinibacteria bacterium CG10_big_fil_rev_8_21_14_0_10_42_8]
GFLGRRKIPFLIATLCRASSDIVRLYPAFAFANIITFLTKYETGASLDPLRFYLLTALLSYWYTVLTREIAKLIGFRVAEKTAVQSEVEGFKHCIELDLSWHESKNTGNKMKQIYKGSEGIVTVLRMWITNFIEISVNFIGITFILFRLDPHSAIGLIIFMIVYYVLAKYISKPALSWVHKVNLQEEDAFGISFEAVNNIRSVKVLGMKDSIVKRMQEKYNDLYACIHKRILWFRARDTVLVGFGTSVEIIMVAMVCWKILQGDLGVGYLVLFLQYFRKTWENVEELAETTVQFAVARYGVARMKDILNEPIVIDKDADKKDFPSNWKTLHLQDLHFAYGKKEVLHSINLKIQRGEKIGIVGLSGAGKSTLFKLLLKEHENYTGDILFDSLRLRDIKRSSFFKHSSVVLQDTELFSFSLKDNIVLVNPKQEDNQELLESVISTTHISDFVSRLPHGIDTLIGEKGLRLSGGEKQRVGIARALFKQPQILFLDEATSHLDLESEEKIQDSLHQCFEQEITAIVIAHRLSTIKEMDRIIVLDQGKIIEQGSFDELYKKRGSFYGLWERQKL